MLAAFAASSTVLSSEPNMPIILDDFDSLMMISNADVWLFKSICIPSYTSEIKEYSPLDATMTLRPKRLAAFI